MLISPEKHKIYNVFGFGFKASNNKAKYEAHLAWLILAKEIKVDNLEIYNDCQLVVYQVTEFTKPKERNVLYLDTAKELLHSFSSYRIKVILRAKNSHINAPAKLASTKDVEFLNAVSVEFLLELCINRHQVVMEVDHEPS